MNDQPTLRSFDPLSLLRDATAAVPATRWAVGVVGLAAAASIIITISRDPIFGLFGVVGVLLAMVALFVFSRLVAVAATKTRPAAVALMWFVVIVFMATVTCLFTSGFFNGPWPLKDRLFKSAVAAHAETAGLTDVAKAARDLSEPSLAKLIDLGRATHHVGYFDATGEYVMAPLPREVRDLEAHGLIEWQGSSGEFAAAATRLNLQLDRPANVPPQTVARDRISPREHEVLDQYSYRLNDRGKSLYQAMIDTLIKQIVNH